MTISHCITKIEYPIYKSTYNDVYLYLVVKKINKIKVIEGSESNICVGVGTSIWILTRFGKLNERAWLYYIAAQ